MTKSVQPFELTKEGLSAIERVQVGDWYWVKFDDEKWDEKKGESVKVGEHEELMCVEHIGSNYVGLRREEEHGSGTVRVLFARFEGRCREELNWREHLNKEMARIQGQIQEKMKEMLAEGRSLYLLPQEGKQPQPQSDSLLPAPVSISPKKYQNELIAFQKRMPEMEKEIKELSIEFAVTAKQLALPDLVKLGKVKTALGVVEDRIFTLELYCGLQETVHQIGDGDPAGPDESIRIMQQMLYMDEETLFDYDDGGMDFQKLKEFDEWTVRPENLKRLAPFPKCIVAFKVRRHDKDYGTPSNLLEAWAHMQMHEENMKTYLLIRNGQKVYRIASAVDFSPRLIPMSNEIGEAQFKKVNHDYRWNEEENTNERIETEERIGPEHVEYDDHVEELDKALKHYNRIIILIQGLLDRSAVFMPHPGIKLTRNDHMEKWVTCVRDEERGLPNNTVTWDAYREQMNKTLRTGKFVWSKWFPDSYGRYNGRTDRSDYTTTEHEVIDRPRICEVITTKRDGSQVQISWSVKKHVYGRYSRWGGWVESHDVEVNRKLWVPVERVFNVSDYNLGDYKMFLCDRALQGKYLDWVPTLLRAEDFQRQKAGRDTTPKCRRGKGWKKKVEVLNGEEYVIEEKGGMA